MTSSSYSPPVITLTTDFGLQDEFVGTMKGVILSLCPQAQLIDITHLIPPQDVATASEIIQRSSPYFPDKSYHLVIVDPGVGSNRPLLAVRTEKHTFVAPDNGILTHVVNQGLFIEGYRIENSDLYLPGCSQTFHGRDIMAPVIARLANGMDISQVGPVVHPRECTILPRYKVEVKEDRIEGEVTGFDYFGNIQTSISASDLKMLPASSRLRGIFGNHVITGLSRRYSDGKKGELLMLLNSHEKLEVAMNCGDAAKSTRVQRGATFTLKTEKRGKTKRE